LLLGLCGLVFNLVSHIFDTLTPAIQADLQWKATRGAAELAQSAGHGMVLADQPEITRAFRDYDQDTDILAIVVTDKNGKPLARHGAPPVALDALFGRPPRGVQQQPTYFASWAESTSEGSPIGRVAVFVSTARILAATRL
jgi:hypothetical protein